MVAWWKRLIYSFVSAVLGAGVCGAAAASRQVAGNSHRPLNAEGSWMLILSFDLVVIAVSLCGWVIAVPLVLLVRNVRGWRFWVYWVIGICFGPVIVLIVNWVASLQGFSLAGIPGGLTTAIYLSAAISGLSSLIYLLLVRRGQTPAAFRATTTVA